MHGGTVQLVEILVPLWNRILLVISLVHGLDSIPVHEHTLEHITHTTPALGCSIDELAMRAVGKAGYVLLEYGLLEGQAS